MKKIYILFFLLTVAFVAAPVAVEAQAVEPQAELTEAQKLALIAVQLEEVEREVNRLTLLVTKITLEKQAANLQRQLAAVMTPERSVATAPIATPPVAMQDAPKAALRPSEVQEDEGGVSQPTFDEATAGEDDDNGVSGFSASLGPLGNLGAPELAALIILALLAGFVLVRRLSDRKKSSSPQVSKVSQTPQSALQSQPTLLQEGRQELSEKVAWK